MLLAEAGLLDGWEATTHCAWCDVLRERFPNVTVRPQRSLVVSGDGQRLIMAGGGTSWMDLVLYIIARTVGLEEAIRVARVNLIDWHNIGQQPFARLARTRQVEDADIARCQTWLAQNYDRRNPVSALVEYSGLPERSFKRRFQHATGMSPLEKVSLAAVSRRLRLASRIHRDRQRRPFAAMGRSYSISRPSVSSTPARCAIASRLGPG